MRRPFYDVLATDKWNAWRAQKGMTADAARDAFVALVDTVLGPASPGERLPPLKGLGTTSPVLKKSDSARESSPASRSSRAEVCVVLVGRCSAHHSWF